MSGCRSPEPVPGSPVEMWSPLKEAQGVCLLKQLDFPVSGLSEFGAKKSDIGAEAYSICYLQDQSPCMEALPVWSDSRALDKGCREAFLQQAVPS